MPHQTSSPVSSSAPLAMPHQTSSSVVDSTGKTRLQASLERAKRGEGASIGQWLVFPGYSLARTVAALGADVSAESSPV